MFTYATAPALLALSLVAPMFAYGATPALFAETLEAPMFASLLGFWLSLRQQLVTSQQHFFVVEIRERQGLPRGLDFFLWIFTSDPTPRVLFVQ